jgi:hypothetical protein
LNDMLIFKDSFVIVSDWAISVMLIWAQIMTETNRLKCDSLSKSQWNDTQQD